MPNPAVALDPFPALAYHTHMGKRAVVIVAALIVATVALVTVVTRNRRPAPRCVFLICMDAVRPDHLGCYGYRRATSPRLDSLAARGAIFEDAVTQAPWTLPSIATVLSSTFPCQHGARRTGEAQVAYSGLEHNFISTLADAGFQTALFTGGLALENKVSAQELAFAAIDWARDKGDKNCLAVIHHYDTHMPYVADPSCILELDPGYEGRFEYTFGDLDLLKQARIGRLGDVLRLTDNEINHIKALYDCQIMRADESVGMIVDSLAAWGRLRDAMIIVFADHGEEFLEHGSIDHGQTVYEETIRVPLLLFCPDLVDGPVRVREQVGLIDLGPTILDALGFKPEEWCEGRSLMHFISARFRAPDAHARPCGLSWKCLVTEGIARRSERKALRCPPWKLIYDPFFGPVELFNIVEDPRETENLIDAEPGMAAALTDSLLVMSRYYPGGWCIAWKAAKDGGKVRGMMRFEAPLIEALAHGFFPEIDAGTDTLMVSTEQKAVRFVATAGDGWQGVEVRMGDQARTEIEISFGGSPPAGLRTVSGDEITELPVILAPDDARVDRRSIGRLFDRSGPEPQADCVIYWIDPGSEPTARQKRQAELRKQLKSIGYIE